MFMAVDLDLRHLRLVQAIAACGSVTRAAERLNLTQSALSHQLRDIEDRLTTPLFTRLGKKMVLTPAGERVLSAAARVLDEVQRAEDDVRQLAQHGAGTIRVCAQCNTGYYWLPRLRVDPLFKDEQVVIVSPSHRLASRSWLEPKDLAQEHLMLYTTDPDDSFALKNILAPAGV